MTVLSFNKSSIRLQMPLTTQHAPLTSPPPEPCDQPRAKITDLGQALSLLEEAQSVIAKQEEHLRKLEKHATVDELTGLANRRSFLLSLRREIGRTRRDNKQAGFVILIDLDDFKQVNDAYGRQVGDNYLQTMASVLINEVRSCDYIARIGGDEFAVLMPEITPKAAGQRIATLQKIIEERVLHHRNGSIPLRASFGHTMIEENKTAESLLIEADLSLYANKARSK